MSTSSLLFPVLLVACVEEQRTATADRAPDGDRAPTRGPAAATTGGIQGELGPTDADLALRSTEGTGFGHAVADAGDIDGDGVTDLIIGDESAFTEAGAPLGGASVFLGPPGRGDLTMWDADVGFIGTSSGDLAGWAVTGVGDLDADGRDDLLVSAVGHSDDAGAVFVQAGPLSGYLDLDRDSHATIRGEAADDELGRWLAPVGDLNNDGFPDLVVSSAANDGARGAAYVFLDLPQGTEDATDADVVLVGTEAGEELGRSFAGCDADGDGVNDLWVGAFAGGSRAGGAVYGFQGPVEASGASADADVAVTGAAGLGYAVACGGDVTGDGKDDLLASAPTASGGDGAAFVVYGPPAVTVNVTTDADITFAPDEPDRAWGLTPAVVGDLTLDGLPDLALGSQRADEDAGELHVFDGLTAGVLGPEDAVARFSGPGLARAGRSVAGLADFDSDGLDELVVGAMERQGDTTSLGAVFLLTNPE